MFHMKSPRLWREHRLNCSKRPQRERKLQPCSDTTARHALALQHGNRGCARAAFPGEITTKAQMVPHFSFVHRNKNWNISFILHYWQRTILMLTLVACSYASISCHCLSSEIWRLFSSGRDMNSKWNNCHESCMIFFHIDIPFLRIDTVLPNKILQYLCVSIFSYTPKRESFGLLAYPLFSE